MNIYKVRITKQQNEVIALQICAYSDTEAD